MNFKRITQAISVMVLILGQSACTVGTLTILVTAVTTAADAALAVLSVSGTLPAPLAGVISSYLTAVGNGVEATSTELASMDTDQEKAIKVTAILTMIGSANFPTDTPVLVKSIINAVDAAIQALVHALAPTASARPGVNVSQYHLTHGDRHKLGQLSSKGKEIAARAQALKK